MLKVPGGWVVHGVVIGSTSSLFLGVLLGFRFDEELSFGCAGRVSRLVEGTIRFFVPCGREVQLFSCQWITVNARVVAWLLLCRQKCSTVKFCDAKGLRG